MLIPSAYAQAAGATGSSPDMFGGLASTFLPLILVFVAFYFLMLRPQQQRVKALQNALGNLKKNDQVITSGGILGKVVKVDDQYVELEIAPTVKIKVVRGTISEVLSPTSAKPAND
ncbi:preprotein translocase subunit YajC [Sphingomonas bacterium]|uniref:preprotein translocase subunit YajC n=1 Tax=Sphingomonas bacterium TaxID=1895847 RepID=UPI0026333A7E|nr:preprotein translocase subunit YajC [Sphingomonas bacterium]MDB5679751.1 yajC [Sphingomonas bacterium]